MEFLMHAVTEFGNVKWGFPPRPSAPSPTPLPTGTSTPDITPTPPNPTDQAATDVVAAIAAFTQTSQAATATASIEAAVAQINNRQLTQTATAMRGTLVAGLTPMTAITAKNIKELLIFQSDSNTVTSVAFSPDGSRFASASL